MGLRSGRRIFDFLSMYSQSHRESWEQCDLSFGDLSELSEDRMYQLIANKALELFGEDFAERMKRGELEFKPL